MDKIINRNAQLRGINVTGTKRSYEFVISSESIDQHKTVFLQSGWELDQYRNNPLVTYNHSINSGDPDNIIGTSEVFFDGNLLIGRIFFEPGDVNPKAEKIRRKVEAGTIRQASISAIPLKYRFGDQSKGEDPTVMYFTSQKLIEWSIVPVGSNPDAHKRNDECINEIRKDILLNRKKRITVEEAQLILNKNRL